MLYDNLFLLFPSLYKGGFPLTENFPRTGTERNRKAHGHARGSREQENFPFRGKLNQVQLFLSFRTEKISYDLSSQSDSFVA